MTHYFTKYISLFGALTALCLSSSAMAATIGICSADIEIRADMNTKEFYSATGERQLLIVSDSPLNPLLCESTSIPQASNAILWSAMLPSSQLMDPQFQLILQGDFTGDKAQVSEIIMPEPASLTTTPLTQTKPQLGNFETLLFGVEERAQWLDGSQLLCTSGAEVAGIQLKTNYEWPEGAMIQIDAFGTGEFQVAVADEQDIENESIVSLGSIEFNGDDSSINRSFSLPATLSKWKAITISCPQGAGSLSIETIAIRPANLITTAQPRSAWIWNPSTWVDHVEFFWNLQELEKISEFYVTVPVNEAGEVNSPEQLKSFIREASRNGVKIWAVIGDRHDVLPESSSILHTRITAYRNYNARVANSEQLAGVQLDIEPYLLPGHTLAKDLWRDRYLETVRAAKQSAGESLHIDLVMPVWWGEHENWGAKLLNELTLPGISLTIMNYRTDYRQLLAGMTPFLDWGIRNEQGVRVALETGSLADETQRAYRRNTQGELWQLQIDATPILVLFDQVQQGLPGVAMSQRFERVFSADKLSFQGDHLRLNDIANRLSEELRDSPSFAGIALHGLDEVYADQKDE